MISNLKSNFEIKILFIVVSFFYYLVPFLVISFGQQINFFTGQNSLDLSHDDLNFSLGFLILFFINFLLFTSIFIFVVNNIYKVDGYNKENYLKLDVFNLLIKILLIFISVFLIFDILKLILFFGNSIKENENLLSEYGFNVFFKYYRDEVKELIFIRRTHYKILIILSVYYYAIDKKISLFFYSVIIIVNLLALSRFEIILLFILHSLVNLKFLEMKKKYLITIIVFLFLLICYRYFIVLYNDFQLIFLISNILGDGNSTFLTNFIFYENIKDTSILFQSEFFNYFDLLKIYFKNVGFYFLNDFLYQNNNTINFFSHNKFANFTFSLSPPLEFFIYLPLLILYMLCFKIFKKCNFLDNKRLFNIILLTLLLFSFRGSWIHEFGFLIKFIILIKIIEIISTNNYVKKYVKKFT